MAEASGAQLKASLEDAQASLAAALGRIEAFRIRERQLMAEVSELRKQVHGPDHQGGSAASVSAGHPAPGGPTPSPGTAAATAAVAQLRFVPSSTGLARSLAKPQAEDWTSPSTRPVYVTECQGEYPVNFVTGSKKVPGSLIVSKGYVDFVEVRARVSQEQFVGITTVKGSSSQGAKDDGDGASTSDATGVWQIMWDKDGTPQRLAFESSQATRESIHRHTQRWLGEVSGASPEGAGTGVATAEEEDQEICMPRNMTAGDVTMRVLGDHSVIVSEASWRALASVVPPLERLKNWSLSYATHKHGISLQTLYRKVVHGLPSLLIVKDFGGYVFGCYTPDSWRVAPRFYGSGETIVFQLEPYRVAYPWRSMSRSKNDFFMYGTPECLAVGGLGHFAIWLDSELLHGSSGTCGTFGSPCLAHSNEFKIQYVEIWQSC